MFKNTKLIIAIFILAILAAGGMYYVQNMQKPVEQDLQTDKQPEVITSDVDTSDWQVYESEEIGLEFKYPSELGELEEKIVNGDTGKKLYISTKNKPASLVFSGITSNYSAPRSGNFSDCQGYMKKGEKYYFRFVSDRMMEVEPIKIIKTPIGDILLVNSNSFVEFRGQPGGPGPQNVRLGAIVNINNDSFSGFSMIKYSQADFSDEVFYKIIETFN